MRVFLAVDVDRRLSYKIQKIQKDLIKTDAPLKLVDSENLHFTFKFFGEINPNQIKQITNITEGKLENYQAFPLHIKGTDFPPRICEFVVGMKIPLILRTSKDLTRIANMGFKKERSYTPHLTIARVKGAHNKEFLADKIQELRDIEIGNMDVDKLVLKKSELTPVGPIYTDLHEFFI